MLSVKHKLVFLLTAFILFYDFACCQVTMDVQRVIGPSPNVTSLFEFNDQPVSLYTGLPQIEIPLYTIKEGKITVPIKLMYHSGGFKVTENAPWTGLGWALDAGGAVTEAVYGLSDLTFLHQRLIKSSLDKCELTSIMGGHYDSQPDLFYFNFLNESGQFYFNDSLQILQMPYSKIKIEPVFVMDTGMTWKITNTDGTVFIFDQSEQGVSTRQTTLTGGGPTIDNTQGSFNHPDISSQTWFLSKIISPEGDSVMFNYEHYSYVSEYFKGETNYFQQQGILLECGGGPAAGVPSNTSSYELQQVNGLRLKSITFRNGSIQFVTGGYRCDLLGDKYLSEIDVEDNGGKIIRKYRLDYNYLTGNSLDSLSQVDCSAELQPTKGTVDPTQPSLKRRLMLMEVDNVNPVSGQVDNSYKMNYATSPGLPSRFSAQQDTWGYYNGNGQYSLLQNLETSQSYLDGINVPIIMGRNPNLTNTEQGMLTKIAYPTGGSSNFTYELNTIRTARDDDSCGAVIVIPATNDSIPATSNNQLITSFTVNACHGGDSIDFEISGCHFTNDMSPSTVLPFGFYVIKGSDTLLSSNDVISASGGNPPDGAKFYLPNGTYSIYSFSSSGPDCSYVLSIPGRSETQYIPNQIPYQQTVGGLRIKQIVHTDPIGNTNIIEDYDYSLNKDGIDASSGVSPSPGYSSLTNSYLVARDLDCPIYFGVESAIVPLMIVSSNTNYPMTLTHGSTVGYAQVAVKKTDQNGNDIGTTVYSFSTPVDEPFQFITTLANNSDVSSPLTNDAYPFAPAYSNEWQRGLLLKKEEYKNNGNGNYSLAERQQNFYSSPNIMDTTHGLVAAYYLNSEMNFSDTCSPVFGNGYNPYSIFKYTAYRLYSEYITLDSTVTETFDNAQNKVEMNTKYSYSDKNLQPAMIKTTNSKNELVISHLTYPLDYTINGTPSSGMAQGIQNLQNQNIITPIIEKYVQKFNADGSNLRTVSAMFNSYKPTIPLPDIVYDWESAAPLTNFTPATITASSVTMDSNYQPRISFDSYDGYGNILQQHKVSGVNHSYLWDYDSSYPIAEAVNAAQTDIAYTSFEADGTGNWIFSDTARNRAYAITGHQSYNLTSSKSITKAGLNSSRQYIVSYWSRNGAVSVNGVSATAGPTKNGWTYYEHKLPGNTTSVTVSGTATIDELRLYPADGQMTTYTYDPLIGMTSQCSMNNTIQYYEYDGLGRLQDIRDQDGNIIKTFEYHYKTGS